MEAVTWTLELIGIYVEKKNKKKKTIHKQYSLMETRLESVYTHLMQISAPQMQISSFDK